MAKINTLTVEGTKKEGYTVTAMTDDGTLLNIEEGFEFVPKEQYDEMSAGVDAEYRAQLDGLKTEIDMRNTEITNLQNQLEGHRSHVEAMHVEIGELQQQLAAKPAEIRAPLLRAEHQDIPVARTVDGLAPLGALVPAPPIDEPYIPALIDPDAPARPPGPQEMSKVHGEYQGTQGPVSADGYTTDEGKTEA